MTNTTRAVNPLQDLHRNGSARQAINRLRWMRQGPPIQLGAGHMGKEKMVHLSKVFKRVDWSDPYVRDPEKVATDVKAWLDKAADKRVRALDGISRQELYLSPGLRQINPDEDDLTQYRFISESLPENYKAKTETLRRFAEQSPDAIIGVDTSSLSVGKIARGLPNPQRVYLRHNFTPVYRADIIEIGRGEQTSDETLLTGYYAGRAEGKTPVFCLKDVPGGAANRIINGLINEAACIVAEGRASSKKVDKVFLEVFYEAQNNLQVPKWKEGRKKIPKLDFFKDEIEIYEKIEEIDKKLGRIGKRRQTLKYVDEVKTLLERKKELIEEKLLDRLNQKRLYEDIGINFGDEKEGVGSFFETPEVAKQIRDMAKAQLAIVNSYIASITKDEETKKTKPEDYLKKFPIKPPDAYKIPDNKRSLLRLGRPMRVGVDSPELLRDVPYLEFNSKKYIKDRLMGAYIGIAYQLYLDGIATAHDIEIMCKAGFKYNVGPFELAKRLGEREVIRLLELANQNLTEGRPTGIATPQYLDIPEDELCGIQTFVDGDVAHIVMGRYHMQDMQLFMNSLHPEMIKGMIRALDKFNADGNVKSIIIESQGSNNGKGVFCSGADLNYIQENAWDTKMLLEYTLLGQELMTKIKESRATTIGVADGSAAGGGLELLAACQYRFGTKRFSGATPEVALGIYPAWFGTKNLAAIIGKEAALAFICNLKGMLPGGWNWLDDRLGMDLGFFDNTKQIATEDLQEFICDLKEGKVVGKVNGKEQLINIREKPNRVSQANKPLVDEDGRANYPAMAVSKLGMKEDKDGNVIHDPPKYHHIGTQVAARGVMYSDDPERLEEELRKLVEGGFVRKTARWFKHLVVDKKPVMQEVGEKVAKSGRRKNRLINIYKAYTQSPTLYYGWNWGVVGTGKVLWWCVKNLAIRPTRWLTGKALTIGAIPTVLTYRQLRHRPTIFELPRKDDELPVGEIQQALIQQGVKIDPKHLKAPDYKVQR